ncbi:SMI1/KNR4 family protein [Actinoallomurus rhizosphaericola]|uniref:SMI1/KNR4 family protein n=1 Tax=Actinoallomurus rhizosphaericola TaxID=2952536 RepID=UPI002090F1BF|nr:SMI1/KNR4 family protein [Actinoallomurus rhizosphaericola]MCO5993743.1 hypothetical protein [Actinoallomurus rhizosphaericola]
MADESSPGPAGAPVRRGSWRWGVGALGTAAVVASVAVVPQLLSGAGRTSAWDRCPARFSFLGRTHLPTRPGAAARLVPGEPGSAVICRYQRRMGGGLREAPARLVGSHPLPDVRSYAERADRLPNVGSGSIGCLYVGDPLADLVLFSYGDGRVQGLSVDESCKLVMNGRRTARADQGFVGLVDALVPSPAPPTPGLRPMTTTPAPAPKRTPLTRARLKAIGCVPSADRPIPVRPDPARAAATNRVWHRIETWLRAHAPATYATLGPPADPRRIAAVQSRLGVRFPDDVVVSLLRHDGVRQGDRAAFEVPLMYRPLSLARIESTWRMLCGIVRDMGDPSGTWWSGRLVPVGEDGTGVTLVADPAHGDRVGVADDEQGLIFDSREGWPSYLALLQATATSLESGRPVRDSHPRVDGSGALDWDFRPPRS